MTTPPPASPEEKKETDFLAPPPAPLDGFPPEEFRARRRKLRDACSDGILVIRGTREEEAINPVRYRQNSSFYYLTGVETPGAFLVLLPENLPANFAIAKGDAQVREILYLPPRNAVAETWTGPQLGPGEETEKATGIEKTVNSSEFFGNLTAWLRFCPLVYTLAPSGQNALSTSEYALTQQILRLSPFAQFRDCAPELAKLRMIKSVEEVARILRAIEITQEGHRAAREVISKGDGKWEYEVEAEVLKAFKRNNANLSFGSIVGSGFRATVLHYENNDQQMRQGELVVVDIGAKDGHYCGDITRAYPVGGKFDSDRKKQVYNLVLSAYQFTIDNFKVGIDTPKLMDDKVKEFLKNSPLRAKNEKGEEKTMDEFMPHSLGHHLGLDVHDVNYPHFPLVQGCVITVEPGVYIPSESIGVRLEDDFLVTDSGLQLLGLPLEISVEEIERVGEDVSVIG